MIASISHLPLWRRVLLKALSPFIATAVATYATLKLSSGSFVSDVISDACFRFPKWWRAIFWPIWYPGAFYYNWTWGPQRGHGPARWHWRRPKNPRWKPAYGWWVFRD